MVRQDVCLHRDHSRSTAASGADDRASALQLTPQSAAFLISFPGHDHATLSCQR